MCIVRKTQVVLGRIVSVVLRVGVAAVVCLALVSGAQALDNVSGCAQSQCIECLLKSLEWEGAFNCRQCVDGVDTTHGTIRTTIAGLFYGPWGWSLPDCDNSTISYYSCGWSVGNQLGLNKCDAVQLLFRRLDEEGEWLNYGDAMEASVSQYKLACGDPTQDNITVTREEPHGKVVYKYYAFTGAVTDGDCTVEEDGAPSATVRAGETRAVET